MSSHLEFDSSIKAAVNTTVREFGGHVTPEGVRNEIVRWFYSAQVNDWIGTAGTEYSVVEHNLFMVAKMYGQAQRAKRCGYSITDAYHYSTDLVLALLPHVYDAELSTYGSETDETQPKGKQDPATGGDRMAMVADVRRALTRLDPIDQYTLEETYRWDYDFLAMAQKQVFGTTADEIQDLHDYALRQVVVALGGAKPQAYMYPIRTVGDSG